MINLKRFASGFLTLLVLLPFSGIALDHTSWTYNASIYEVNVRQYTKEGTFNAFRPHLTRLKNLGVSIIWFMPIHPIGAKNRLGSLGSYYSVKDYYGVNAEFGTLADFKALVDTIHSKGMYVIMDWVADHTSWDNALTTTHPDWYKKNSTGGFMPPAGTGWTDVIQLDLSNTNLRTYMISAMKYWLDSVKVDGFRCDAASFVPVDFWLQATLALKADKPGVFMLAEDQGSQYFNAGFNMTYGWNFYGFGGGILPKLVSGQNNAANFATYVSTENTQNSGNNYRMYFTSNHDENSWYGTDVELFGAAADEFIALSMVFRSVPEIYGGQEAGLNHRLKFFDKDSIVWNASPRAGRIGALMKLKTRNSALWNGTRGSNPVQLATSNSQSIYAFLRSKGTDKVCGIFNLSSSSQTFTLTAAGFAGTFHDVIKDSTLTLTQNGQMTLPAWGYTVLENSSATGVEHGSESFPAEFSLAQNYPNPFNPSTDVRFRLSESGYVTLKVIDVLGREVRTLVEGNRGPGEYSAHFDANGLTSGLYFYRLNAAPSSDPSKRFSQTRKMLLVK